MRTRVHFRAIFVLLACAMPAASAIAQSAMDAQYVRCEVPATVLAGEVFRAQVIMRNSGTNSWGQQSTEVKTTLVSASPDFNTNWCAWFIPQGQGTSVPPGSNFAFTSWLIAPSTPGDYGFNWGCQNWIPEGGATQKDKPFFGGMAIGPTIRVLPRNEAAPAESLHRDGVLDRHDFEYAGTIRLPGLPGFEDVYTSSGLALRTVNGGKRLLLTTGTYASRLYEITTPAPVRITNGNYSVTPVAEVTRDWGDLNYGVVNGEHIEANGGFWFDNTAGTLYWTHYNSYFTGGPGDFPQLLATRLDADGTKTNVGFWHVPNTVARYKSYWGGIIKLPQSFADTYTGGRDLALGFGGYFSICGTASRGPALGAIARPGTSGGQLDLLELMTYVDPNATPREGNYFSNIGYWGTQPKNPWTGWWTGVDECRAGVFIDLPEKRGYLAFSRLGVGRLGYDYGGHNADGHYQNYWYFDDAADLGAVALGQRAPGSMRPASYNAASFPLPSGKVTGACFDADTRLLYLYVMRALPNQPAIHVFRVKTGYSDVQPPSIPTGLSAASTATNAVTLNWTPSTDNEQVAGYHIFHDGRLAGTSGEPRWYEAGLTPGALHHYRVAAVDSRGLLSGQSDPAAFRNSETFEHGLTPAGEIHVATHGNDTTGDGSPGAPYRTITRAANLATPGTAVRVHAGTYAGGISLSDIAGTAAAPVWIGGVAGEARPVISGGSEALHLTRVRYLVLHDLEITGAASNGINCDDGGDYANSNATRHVVFRNLYIHHIGTTGNQDGLKLSGVYDYFVLDSEISDGSSGGSGIDHVGCHGGLLTRNRFIRAGVNAVQCKGGSSNIEIRANWFEECGARTLNIGGSTGFTYFRPPLSTNAPNVEARDIRVIANVIKGSDAPLAFVGALDCAAFNNTILFPHNWAVRILQETTSSGGYTFAPCGSNAVANNIFYYDGTDISGGGLFNIGVNTAPATFTLANNLWFNFNNPASSNPNLPAAETNGIRGQNPLFVAAASDDFRLRPGSPALAQGASRPQVVYDYAGAAYGNPPDIGAFAFAADDYSVWRHDHFTGDDLANDAVSGPAADSDGCGYANFVRYAFGLPARGPVAAPATYCITNSGGHRHLALEFDRRASGNDLRYVVEAGNDLVAWTAIATNWPGTPPRVTVRDAVAIGDAGTTRRFLRLRVTQP